MITISSSVALILTHSKEGFLDMEATFLISRLQTSCEMWSQHRPNLLFCATCLKNNAPHIAESEALVKIHDFFEGDLSIPERKVLVTQYRENANKKISRVTDYLPINALCTEFEFLSSW